MQHPEDCLKAATYCKLHQRAEAKWQNSINCLVDLLAWPSTRPEGERLRAMHRKRPDAVTLLYCWLFLTSRGLCT